MAERYATGGVIRAGGPADDSIPVILGRGCAVVSSRTVKHLGRDLIERMNGGNTDVFTAAEVLEAYDADDQDQA